MDGGELSAHERVAKILVDHFINFKGCRRHTQVVDKGTGLKEFIKERSRLLQRIPEFQDPDFAQIERLPAEARLGEADNDEIEDEWRKFSQHPLYHMSSKEWKKCYETVGRIFTGGDDSDDEEGINWTDIWK